MADGFVIVTVVVRRDTGEVVAGPELMGRSLRPELDNRALETAAQDVRKMLERQKKGEVEHAFVARRIKESAARSLYRKSRSRPLILPVLTKL
jgi:ribonuclease J